MSRPAAIAKLLLGPLYALSARSTAAVGDSYARVAQALLTQYERIEDEAAERRYQRQLAAEGGTDVAKSS